MKWEEKFCCVCADPVAYIEIRIATGDGSEYPYTETTLCESCWRQHGIEVAFDHNVTIKEG